LFIDLSDLMPAISRGQRPPMSERQYEESPPLTELETI
jgi:hypothetical protein